MSWKPTAEIHKNEANLKKKKLISASYMKPIRIKYLCIFVRSISLFLSEHQSNTMRIELKDFLCLSVHPSVRLSFIVCCSHSIQLQSKPRKWRHGPKRHDAVLLYLLYIIVPSSSFIIVVGR